MLLHCSYTHGAKPTRLGVCMNGRRRSLSVAVLSVLAMAVVGVSLSWACTNPGFGTPSAPPPPAASEPSGGGNTAAAPAGSTAPAKVTDTGTSPSSSPTSSTSGAVDSRANTVNRVESRQVADGGAGRSGSGVPAAPSVGRESIAARERGATAGVDNSGKQPVFASSQTPQAKPPKAKQAARAAAPSLSQRSATSELWSAFEPATSSVRASEAQASLPGRDDGRRLAIALFGLGFVGILGTLAAVAASRRRWAQASSARGSRGENHVR